MNLSPRWAAALALCGFEAAHWSSVGAANASDAEIMEYANAHGYVILTHDLDFCAMLAASRKNRPSIVQVRAGDVSPDNAVPLVAEALGQAFAEIEAGAILTVELNKARLRILPL